MKKKFIVTGGAGLIGLEVCRQLSELGHEVRLFDVGEQIKRVEQAIAENVLTYYGSILDPSSLRMAMSDCQVVIHLAAMLGVRRTEADKLRCIEVNIEGTKNVLDCAVQHRVDKVVFASSSEVYGEPQNNPITEEFITQGKTVYAVTKLAGEEFCRAYAQKYSLEYTILRYFNTYGPYQTAQFVITKFISNVLKGIPPLINGDGKQVRSYTYVSDTARATILAALNDAANKKVLNVGNGKFQISLKGLAEKIIELGGMKGKLEPEYSHGFENTDRNLDREIFIRFCDSRKAERMLDWKPEVRLEEGIQRTMKTGVIFERYENFYDEQN